ncbi:MAG: BREX system P-loop protein BrxC [Deltaproteobacteria bacterium]|nr:BREX system P-loop protein BrxC [Deltaproteobacteria bacterium]
MQIKSLFKKDIFRSINGVIKAQQLDENSVWQELDEFVLTQELDRHFRDFLTAYLNVMDNPNDPAITGKMGVWISGFFGSGKSHFIKVLSYLLGNKTLSHSGQQKQAIDFLNEKVSDAMLLGDIKRAGLSKAEVILFNIDSKADSRPGRDAILSVFLKVLNEIQGFDGDHPHIAHMERYLASKNKLKEFHKNYLEITGTEWLDERDAYAFNRDQVIEAFQKTLEQSRESAEKWIDNAPGNFSLTVENLAKWIKEYLDSRGPNSRLVFLVDEIGQFIGTDGHLMLNLQTVIEDLGTLCKGRAWVIVTSQEEINKVIGELRTSAKNDFSKIQGRFRTRLSLSSRNADEVIRRRILEKNDDVKEELSRIFREKGDILRNQLSFMDCRMTLKPYSDMDDFAWNYPFVPYQFALLQKIFEVIRNAGATGLHLAKGERSMLDAFQSAVQNVALKDVGVLVPLYEFYPSIESFLDTSVKRTINQASDNPNLEPFDIKVLQVLFLIRHVEEIKGNTDNLVTLCLEEIDADRIALKQHIEASLQRLESINLIKRNGDRYFFLTNEERDINREIKGIDLSTAEESRLLGDMIFSDIYKDQRKHRYTKNKMDFGFTRLCDLYPVGNKTEGGLVVSVISPLNEDYDKYSDRKCILDSSNEGGQIIIRLRDDENFDRELRTYARTDKYLRTKSDSNLPTTAQRVRRDNAEENRVRRERLNKILAEMLVDASYFIAGQKVNIKASAPISTLEEAFEYLITNTFSKMSYLEYVHSEPEKEIQAVLKSNDIAQQSLDLTIEQNNPKAIEDLRNYVDLCNIKNHSIIISDMIEKRYSVRPYGWPEMEVILLICRLLAVGEISLKMDADILPLNKVFEQIKASSKWKKITIHKRKTSDPEALQRARKTGKDVFSEMGPDNEDALCAFLKNKLKTWETSLNSFKPLADTGEYPGKEEITEALNIIRPLLSVDESYKFIDRFNANKDDLLDLSDNFHTLEQFYENQMHTWDKLRLAYNKFDINRFELEQDETAAPALKRMQEILSSKAPYGIIHETDGLVSAVKEINNAFVKQKQSEVLSRIDGFLNRIKKEVQSVSGDGNLIYNSTTQLQNLRDSIERIESIAHLAQMEQEAEKAFDNAMGRIEAFVNNSAEKKQGVSEPQKIKPRRVVKPVELVGDNYLESIEDINRFLNELRQKLEEAIKSGDRIQIR